MNQEIEIIKKLKKIKPDEAFVLKTRLLLLNEKQKKFIFGFNLRYAYVFLIIFIIFISFFYFQKNNEKRDLAMDLKKEFLTLKVNQHLDDLKLRNELNQSIELTLNYIKNEKINVSEEKINQEMEKINEVINLKDKSKEINNLLNLITN